MKKKYLLIIPIIILAYFLGNRLSFHAPQPIATKNTSKQLKTNLTIKQKITSYSESQQRKKNYSIKTTNIWQEIKKCYPNIQPRTDFPLADIFQQLSEENDYQDIIDFDNYHLTLENGELRRVQIRLDETPQGKQFKVLKIFSVDQQQLPVPLKTIKHPTPEQIDEYLNGSITFTQKIGNRIFDENNYISFVQENGEIQSFEAYLQGHVLKCTMDINEQSDCHCDY